MKRVLVSFAFLLAMPCCLEASAQTGIQIKQQLKIAEGAELIDLRFQEVLSRPRARIVRFQRHLWSIAAASAKRPNAGLRDSMIKGSSGFTLETFARASGSAAAITGGYLSSFSPPNSLGFVKSAGEVFSPLHNSWLTEGFICSDRSGVVVIGFPLDSGKYKDCLQSGPILIKNAKIYWNPNSESQRKLFNTISEQSIVCVSNRSIVLIITDDIRLSVLLPIMIQNRNVFDCDFALRLSGSVTADLYLAGKGNYHNTDMRLPSALVVYRR